MWDSEREKESVRESGCAGVWDSERGRVCEIVREIKRVCEYVCGWVRVR